MNEFLRQLVTGINEAWKRLSVNARVQIGLSALLTLALFGGAIFMGAQPQYTLAYNGLERNEAGEMVAWLSDQGIPYRLTSGGTSIEIPADHVSDAKVGLASMDLPRSQGVVPGFELFNTRDLMSNNFQQKVQYQRAVNGELQRQLNQFDFVRNSSVFIREAPERLFSGQQQSSYAAVTLDILGGPLLGSQKKAVLGVITTYGGANLSSNNVTITDTQANPIHMPIEDTFAAMASSHLEARVNWETQRAKSVESMFKQAGINAIIRVSATMDWSTEDIQKTTLEASQPISTMETTVESSTTDGASGGPAGAIANVPVEPSDGGGTVTSSTETTLIENLDVPRTITNTSQEPGRVTKHLVTAFIEGTYTPAGEDGGEPTYVPLTQAKLDEYAQSIAFAVGDGTEVADVIVIDQPFQVVASLASTIPTSSLLQNPKLWQAAQVLLIIFAFVLLRVFIRRAMVLPSAEIEEVIEMPTMSAEEQHKQDIASEVERLSNEEPETVAALLRTWIAEDD